MELPVASCNPQVNGQFDEANQESGWVFGQKPRGSASSLGRVCPKLSQTYRMAIQLTPFSVSSITSLHYSPGTSAPKIHLQWMSGLGEPLETTHQRLEQVTLSNKEFADRHRTVTLVYQPRDCVWLSTKTFASAKAVEAQPSIYIRP